MIKDISCEDLRTKLDAKEHFVLLDVREQDEYDICHFDNALLIPLGDLKERYHTLDTEIPVIVYCKMGGRSAQASAFLMEKGFKDVKNLDGGIRRWSLDIDPDMPMY